MKGKGKVISTALAEEHVNTATHYDMLPLIPNISVTDIIRINTLKLIFP